ncbi:MAG: hypothetical protein ACYCW6_02655 [Candidatus Xenobia bacterium]
MKSRALLGAHLSAAGTFTRGLDRAEVLRADCLQIFTRRPMVIETPDNQNMDEVNLKLLRRLSRSRKVERVAGG